VDKSDALDSILIGLEKTICIVARCAIYELLYLDRTRTAAASNLEKSIVKLYSEILKFVAKGIAKSKGVLPWIAFYGGVADSFISQRVTSQQLSQPRRRPTTSTMSGNWKRQWKRMLRQQELIVLSDYIAVGSAADVKQIQRTSSPIFGVICETSAQHRQESGPK